MQRGSEWLSQGAEVLAAEEDACAGAPPAFDVVIVGSGYGAAVAASRIAEWGAGAAKPPSVAVLERGLEYQPGDFPATLEALVAHVRMSGGTRAEIRGVADGLFDLKLGDDVSALVANGLGGGSLINAGVAEQADDQTLADAAWPRPWRGDAVRWKQLYDEAHTVLGAQPWASAEPGKRPAMAQLARTLGRGATVRAVDLTITPAGSDAGSCTRCGNCFSGCNDGAKQTLARNLLGIARGHGAHLFTGATVLDVAKDPSEGGWLVHWAFSDPGRLPARTAPYTVRTRRVVLAAGTFGSTEILMRSQCAGLRFSGQLGHHFSTNADVIGAQCELKDAVRGWAREPAASADAAPGPTITHMVELGRSSAEPRDRVVVEDLTVPAPLGWLFGELMTSLMLPQRWTRFHGARTRADTAEHTTVDPAALDRTLLVAALGHDGAQGRLQLLPGFERARHDGNLSVHWPRAGEADCFGRIDRLLLDATQRMRGAFWVRNPIWQAVPDSPLIEPPTERQLFTVHPLGGCRMAETMKTGVVDPFGRVFDAGNGDRGDAPGRSGAPWAGREDRRIHEGLYVLDGSIVPTSLGINPLLTITALALGIVAQWLREWGEPQARTERSLSAAPGPARPRRPTPARTTAPTRLAFSERMYGRLACAPLSGGPAVGIPRINLGFRFQSIEDLQAFTRRHAKSLTFQAALQFVQSVHDPASQRQTDQAPSAFSGPHALNGTVRWFERRPSAALPRMWRTLQAWYSLRAGADLAASASTGASLRRTGKIAIAFMKMLSHFGDARYLVYDFEPLRQPMSVSFGNCTYGFAEGTVFHGEKRLVYEPGGNPWEQLTGMTLYATDPGGSARQRVAELRYDEIYMMGRDELPLTLEAQADGVAGLRDLLSLMLYAGRVVFAQHFLTFRKPDYAAARPWRRLPYPSERDDFKDLELSFHDGVWSDARKSGCGPLQLRLTRYRLRDPAQRRHATPVLLLHGFGSGGIQFTHEAIRMPMAQWLALQGRDVWVGEMRTSIGLPSCEQQWVMDDIATEDIPALVDAVRIAHARERGVDAGPVDDRIDIVAHCIGAAMFCMAALSPRDSAAVRALTPDAPRPLGHGIRRVVLMQVGPVVHLPRGNRMRGYLGNRAQKLLGLGMVKATVDADATAGEQALDRVLASFPYMGGSDPQTGRLRDADPGLALSRDAVHNGRLVNAMRSAGVFAQLFQWRNMHDGRPGATQPLLDALPDLLGACNLTTYQQTVQYALLRRLTNQDGASPYVTDPHIRRGLSMPLLFIQGGLNDVFAQRGTLESMRLLQEVIGAGNQVERHLVEDYGHLDCVVGNDAATDVFPRIARFLDGHVPPPAGAVAASLRRAPRPWFRRPTIGPWIGDACVDPTGTCTLTLGLKVDEQRNPPSHIYTIVARPGQPGDASTLTAHATPVVPAAPTPAGAIAQQAAAFWEEGEAVLRVTVPAAYNGQAVEVRVCTTLDAAGADIETAGAFAAAWDRQVLYALPPERGSRDGPAAARPGSVVLDAGWWRTQAPGAASLDFLVVCCRQAPLLIDRQMADRGFGKALREAEGLSHVLMIGDQVYADSLAASGGVQGTRLRFFDAYREAWTAANQRALMARLPAYMAADDHEFRNDHGNSARGNRSREWRSAFAAMWRYEYAAGPAGWTNAQRPRHALWYEMKQGGFPTFVCDTRNRRFEGSTVDGRSNRIMAGNQFDALARWLRHSRESGRPRFLVMSTPIAPVFRNAVGHDAYRLRSDGWLRFPASLERLFELLALDGAQNLFVVGGDYHCFSQCTVEVEDCDKVLPPLAFESVACPGIYSPYDFANTAPEELWSPDAQQPWLRQGRFRWRYCFKTAPLPMSGYVRVSADAQGRVGVEARSA
jgi:choline dehydrogenase-like flavoprotein